MSLQGCTLAFNDVQIQENQANYLAGGGMDISSGSIILMSYCEILDNETIASGADGVLSEDSSILFQCCEVDAEKWRFEGTVEYNNEGCTVSTTTLPLSSLKAMYR